MGRLRAFLFDIVFVTDARVVVAFLLCFSSFVKTRLLLSGPLSHLHSRDKFDRACEHLSTSLQDCVGGRGGPSHTSDQRI